MEQHTAFVSSRGIARSCETHNAVLVSSSSALDGNLAERHRPGGAIYVCTDALSAFAQNVAPRLESPFHLVSGDSDFSVDDALLGQSEIQALLGHPHLLGWRAQNLASSEPRLEAMPIGLDYHTVWERPGFWEISSVSPIAQESSLLKTLAASPTFGSRYLFGYCNWHFRLDRGDRAECFEQIAKQACFFEAQPIPRHSTLMRQAEFMFVISPHGFGLDCHRTWEALILGCIPVVKTSPLDRLFKNLPVMIVEQWGQVTRESLVDYARSIQESRFDFSPLFRDHWARIIRGQGASPLPPMTIPEFRQFLTRGA